MLKEKYTSEDTIFVQIPCYRDPEFLSTINDIYNKAKRPENIFVGITLQYDMSSKEECKIFECKLPMEKQIRIKKIDYRENDGICWSKSITQKLYQNEKYTLMTDPHIIFKQNWDEDLVRAAKTDNFAIITQSIPSFSVSDSGAREIVSNEFLFCTTRNKFENGMWHYLHSAKPFGTKILINSCIFFANFIFGKSDIIQQYKFNKNLHGEDEWPFALYLWTHGANIYNYNDSILWHLWNKTNRPNYKKNDVFSFEYVELLMNAKKTNNISVIKTIKNDNILGNKRTLRDYERFSGIDFRKKTIKERTHRGVFEDWKEVDKIKNIKNLFKKLKNKE